MGLGLQYLARVVKVIDEETFETVPADNRLRWIGKQITLKSHLCENPYGAQKVKCSEKDPTRFNRKNVL